MIRSLLTILPLFALLWLTGCNQKNYFEPEKIEGRVLYDGELPAPIVEIAYAGATLENGQVITPEGLQAFRLPEGYRFVSRNGDLVVAAADCKPSILYDVRSGKSRDLNLSRRVVAALVLPEGGKLAFLTEGNAYGIYDYEKGEVVARYVSDPALTADIRIANPILLDRLVIVPTLDGKLAILNGTTGEKVREIVVGGGEEFDNIIFLKVIGNRLVAATPHRIVSVSPRLMDSQTMEIAQVIFVDDAIYILAKDGNVYHCDLDLKILHRKKFPFAHFVGAIYGEYIYLVEREGYIIATDPLLASDNVFEIPDRIEGWLYTTPDTLYYKRYYFRLHTPDEESNGSTSAETGDEAETGETNATAKGDGSWFSGFWNSLRKFAASDDNATGVGEE